MLIFKYIFFRRSFFYLEQVLNTLNLYTGQTQQVVTQIIRGQPVSTAVSSPTTVSTSQKMATTTGTPAQNMQLPTAPHPPRPQQGQVKLTMAQLTQLTQGQVSK